MSVISKYCKTFILVCSPEKKIENSPLKPDKWNHFSRQRILMFWEWRTQMAACTDTQQTQKWWSWWDSRWKLWEFTSFCLFQVQLFSALCFLYRNNVCFQSAEVVEFSAVQKIQLWQVHLTFSEIKESTTCTKYVL